MKVVMLMLMIAGFVACPAAISQKNHEPIEPFPMPNTHPPVGYSAPARKITLAEQHQEEFCADVRSRIYGNWEPDRLSPDKTMTVFFVIHRNGEFTDTRLHKSSGIPQVDFACLEAVCESSAFVKDVPSYVAGIEIPFNASKKTIAFDCAGKFRRVHPNMDSNAIVWHLIPLDAVQSVNGLLPSVVHSEQNLRVIKSNYTNSVEMEKIRAEWVAFLRSKVNRTPQEVLQKAQSIEQRYAHMFETVGTGHPAPTEAIR